MAGQYLPTAPSTKSGNLNTLSTREAVNAAGSGGGWAVNTIASAHDGTADTDTKSVDVSGAGQLGIYAAGDIYFRFSSGAAQDCVAANDLLIPSETLTFITVPRGLGPTIYFNHLGVAACTVRIVEV